MRFFLAWSEDRAVGWGGVALFAGWAEVKRMYTTPQARGRGVAKALLRRVESEARAVGAALLNVETGAYRRRRSASTTARGFVDAGRSSPMRRCRPANIATSLFFEKPLA